MYLCDTPNNSLFCIVTQIGFIDKTNNTCRHTLSYCPCGYIYINYVRLIADTLAESIIRLTYNAKCDNSLFIKTICQENV